MGTTMLTRRFIAAAALVSATATSALAVPTQHELRITSFTSLSVAQAFLQRIICSAPNACLQNEVRLPMTIDFDTGEVVLDATAPTDENGTPVLPFQPGGILCQTLSGPVEMRFAEPCLNPDGCPAGPAVYTGTIDQAGNLRFPDTIGVDFELFGVTPTSKFRAEVGTGSTTDSVDPGVVAEGTPINFATGQVVLAGIDFIPAPVVGTVLQLNRITATIFPLPVPPATQDDLMTCQKALDSGGAAFVKTKQKALQACVDALLACEVAQEAGSTPPANCQAKALALCERSRTKISGAETSLRKKIPRGCSRIGVANLLAAQAGLNLALDKPQCDAISVAMTDKDKIAECVAKTLECRVEEMVARLKPRAAEVLAANGYSQFLPPQGCIPVFSAGDATGTDGDAVLDCQSAIEKQGGKYVKIKQKELHACIDAALECHLAAEEIELGGGQHQHDPACVAKAQRRCDAAVTKISAAESKKVLNIQRGCASLDAAGIPALAQGLGFSNLTAHCQALNPPGNLSNLDGLIDCLDRSLDCSIEGTVRTLQPRAAEALTDIGIGTGGTPAVERYPCLAAACGDGILDVGEECDPLFADPTACNADCTAVVCGDGQVQGNEECDDGNTVGGDGCAADCTDEPFACGNAIVEPGGGEVCDDGDSAAGDGCNADCKSNETCGNGVVDTIRGEQCDDGGNDFVAALDTAQEVPAPVGSTATGTATFTLNGNSTLTYNVTATNLTGPGIACHIHVGAPGVPGGILITLSGGPTVWSGTTAALTIDQIARLKAGGLYVNVHTAANGAGEIRGQIGFATPVGGDGCSADCRSDETCGNGVIDSTEACDDGNTASGDGCDASCQLESCSFISGGSPLGTRNFSIDPATSGLFNSIVGLGTEVGDILASTISLTASATDAGGSAAVTLDSDVIVKIDIVLGGTVQCLKLEAAGTTGSLHCCGGHAVGTSFTRDSNTGGVPASGGQANGPAVRLGGVGTGGVGDLLMAFSLREAGGPTGTDCTTATYGSPRTEFLTTGTATARVVRPAQGGAVFEFSSTGQPFDCSTWTTSDGVGTLLHADTALNAVPGIDAGNVRKFDD